MKNLTQKYFSILSLLALVAILLGLPAQQAAAESYSQVAGTVSITGFVWDDVNRNGIQDPGEPGIAGRKVTLVDCLKVIGSINTATDANGIYQFSGLPDGTYSIAVSPVAGTSFSAMDQGGDDSIDSDVDVSTGRSACTALEAGDPVLDVDAGIHPTATGSLGDFVWEDLNVNGIQDSTEKGIAHVQVDLFVCGAATPIATTFTDETGHYGFSELLTNMYYQVMFHLPAGLSFSNSDLGGDDNLDSDVTSSSGKTACTYLASGENKTSVDAGIYLNVPSGKLGDFVWEDQNMNGVQDLGEPGIAGVTIKLYTCEGALIATTITDANGMYYFSDLIPGSYKIEVVKPAGYAFTTPLIGDLALDSNILDQSGFSDCVIVSSGQFNRTLDAGLYQMASIGDFVWVDANNNGVQDAGEAGKESVTVSLYTCAGVLTASTTTDLNGYYSFSVNPGNYYLVFTAPNGYTFSPQNVGDDLLDSDADQATGQTECTTLVSGENDPSWDAGLYLIPAPVLGSIGDFVWEDINADGVYDPSLGEMPIANVLVQLYDCDGNLLDDTTTNDVGYYDFTDLMAGCYTVVIAPGNFLPGGALYGYSQTYDYDLVLDHQTTVNLAEGQHFLAADFGYRKLYAPGTGTPGYWKNHPEAWPVDSITIGGITYTKDTAISLMEAPTNKDKTYTMFQTLVAAKLNGLVGNDISCVSDAINAADAWMALYPAGSGVKASSAAWTEIESIHTLLDNYNNGLLCAPARD